MLSSVLFLWSAVAFGDATWEKGLKWLFGVTAIVSILWLGVRWLAWRTTHFVITSDRLIARKGIIAKSGIEIPLERVNNVSFNQSIFERVIKAGDLLIESGGEDGQQRFTDILRPDEVQNLIHLQMEENQRRTFTPAAQPIDVAGQLEKLEALRDRGTITEAEFESQKRRLLD